MLNYLNIPVNNAHMTVAYHKHDLHRVVWNTWSTGLFMAMPMAIVRRLVMELQARKTTGA